jgi:hypothetical protein
VSATLPTVEGMLVIMQLDMKAHPLQQQADEAFHDGLLKEVSGRDT